eukprot:gb/GECG01002154.1/.p1 GENE.gb/GECG01002154.1/~~gb/GECG01002154.1/.p1  ORF type:complete len:119 (+),score=2.65 gb/GECG01002154.1/:1-357(+)
MSKPNLEDFDPICPFPVTVRVLDDRGLGAVDNEGFPLQHLRLERRDSKGRLHIIQTVRHISNTQLGEIILARRWVNHEPEAGAPVALKSIDKVSARDTWICKSDAVTRGMFCRGVLRS